MVRKQWTSHLAVQSRMLNYHNTPYHPGILLGTVMQPEKRAQLNPQRGHSMKMVMLLHPSRSASL